jgi:hypothetical protein
MKTLGGFLGISALLFVAACSTGKGGSGGNPAEVQLLSFVPEKKIGLVVGGIDWKKPAAQDNPGVDCTLKLERQGPPESVFTCVIREKGVPFIVRVYESFKSAEARSLQKITVDSKSQATLDRWVAELKKYDFDAEDNKAEGKQWDFVSSDGDTHVTIFWNKASKAVSLVLRAQ